MSIQKSTSNITTKRTFTSTPQSAEKGGKCANSFSLFIIAILRIGSQVKAVTLLLFYAAFTYASHLRAVLDNRSRYLDLLQDGAVSSNPVTTSFPRKSSSSWAVSFLRPVWGSHPSFYTPGPGMREEFPQHEAVSRSPTPDSHLLM